MTVLLTPDAVGRPEPNLSWALSRSSESGPSGRGFSRASVGDLIAGPHDRLVVPDRRLTTFIPLRFPRSISGPLSCTGTSIGPAGL